MTTRMAGSHELPLPHLDFDRLAVSGDWRYDGRFQNMGHLCQRPPLSAWCSIRSASSGYTIGHGCLITVMSGLFGT